MRRTPAPPVPIAALAGVLACSAPGGPASVTDPSFGGGSSLPARGGADGAAAATDAPVVGAAATKLRCLPARGKALPARINVMSAAAPTAPRNKTMFTADLFNLFKSHCGGCHVDAKLGGFQATARTFGTTVDAKAIATIKAEDPAKFMPPLAAGGKPYSKRAPGDPLVELVTLLEQWTAQNRPADAFKLAQPEAGEAGSPFLLTEAVGKRMTNLGDCVMEPGPLPGEGPKMADLDAFFAKATELPETLDQTDLFTLDGETLARSNVVAFSPAYPLWTDDAAKIRHIRVPRGQSVKFNKDKQQFEIPPNTRFYKTFLKEVVDRDKNKSYRKMETRLIVSRPDRARPDGTAEVTALYGAYIWNEEETEARLLRDPLRNGKPFRDRLLTYSVDEPKVQQVIDSKPRNLSFALEEENKGLLRRYAIPSGERCVECHMGSVSASFVLGFSPLQIAHRLPGTGGVTDPPSEDEFSQLPRLVRYGVISGVTIPDDVLPLERSQGSRAPRNGHELKAQGYLLGNCSNCHNPRGFPSVKSPELKDVLDFQPSATGGIFQFPLERMSPLRRRGVDQDVPMPYITPSLREYPVAAEATPSWKRKWADCRPGSPEPWFICDKRKPGEGAGTFVHVDAPWRSLLYRNVDTPYAYADDFVVFPRMPMHVAGYDCRAPRILGDWMVSIPAVRKDPSIPEDAVPLPGGRGPVDKNPQPYKEVKPGEPGYAQAVTDAAARLKRYREGGRYEFCAENGDVVMPSSVISPDDPTKNIPPTGGVIDPKNLSRVIMPGIGVPTEPHWIVTDLTDPAGDWFPRRPDWSDVLVGGKTTTDNSLSAHDRLLRKLLAEVFPTVVLSDELKRFALSEVAFGLWDAKEGCDFSGVRKVADLMADPPRWLATRPGTAADAPVYMQTPGAAIYGTICFNCHGPQADSKGLLSEAIMLMTGGDARVANFRDGLFGPVGKAGDNRRRVFSAPPPTGTRPLAPDDLGARYTAWMALGGTERRLPPQLLNIVATTRVLGELRDSRYITAVGTPNMLQLAYDLCSQLLPIHDNVVGELSLANGGFDLSRTALITKNGDAEMWQKLCNIGNRQIVRVPYVLTWDAQTTPTKLDRALSFYWADAYPQDAPVLDHRGRVVNGVKPDNLFPVCIRKPAGAEAQKLADKFLAENPVGGPGGPKVPYCPKELFDPDDRRWLLKTETDSESRSVFVDGYKWALRGAINAGLAVFAHLDELTRGQGKPKPAFNRCEDLKRN
jgi:mono/diheme cytochrome c family protein